MHPTPKPLVWVGSSRADLKSFPEEVRLVMGYALYLAQVGGKHPDAKPLRGFGGAGVLEVVDDLDGDTYRAVYTVKLRGVVPEEIKEGDHDTATRHGSREAAAQASGGDPRPKRRAAERRRQ